MPGAQHIKRSFVSLGTVKFSIVWVTTLDNEDPAVIYADDNLRPWMFIFYTADHPNQFNDTAMLSK